MRQHPEVGENRTTRSQHPEMYDAMQSGPEEFGPTSEGDGAGIASVRQMYSKEAGPVGHVPQANGAALDEATVDLLDKMGERMAFERSGTRLYDGLLSKYDAYGSFAGGPTRAELEHIRHQEHEHFLMLMHAVERMGGDPSAITPSADLTATIGKGIGDVVTDPRTSLLECLDAILVAELADNDGWELLIELARKNGQAELERAFTTALEQEREHLTNVRAWIMAAHDVLPGIAAE
jgi:rubrerythrin